MSKVIVVGSANLDFTVAVDRLPRPGQTVLGGEFSRSFGGKGANQAVAAKRAGADVVLLTKLGNDPNGWLIEQHLLSVGLPKEGILPDPARPTGVALIVVDRTGQNQIAVAPGSNQSLGVDDVRHATSLIAGGNVLLVQLEVPLDTVVEALRIAKAHGLTTILNPAPAVPLSTEVLKLVDVLTPNEGEAELLSGQDDPDEAARVVLYKGARAVVVTLGERGALLRDAETQREFPAFSVHAVDTTGAGDAFSGALACALAEGQAMEDAIVFANAAGALATTKRGAQDSLPTRADIGRLWGTSR